MEAKQSLQSFAHFGNRTRLHVFLVGDSPRVDVSGYNHTLILAVSNVGIGTVIPTCIIQYSGLFSWVEIFVKRSIWPPELNFMVLNLVALWAVI